MADETPYLVELIKTMFAQANNANTQHFQDLKTYFAESQKTTNEKIDANRLAADTEISALKVRTKTLEDDVDSVKVAHAASDTRALTIFGIIGTSLLAGLVFVGALFSGWFVHH
jgi:hypothetical protein